MDKSYLPQAVQRDCEKTGNFAKEVVECRLAGNKLVDVLTMIRGGKSNNTTFLEELATEIYDGDLGTIGDGFNFGWNKYERDVVNRIGDDGLVETGIPANELNAPWNMNGQQGDYPQVDMSKPNRKRRRMLKSLTKKKGK